MANLFKINSIENAEVVVPSGNTSQKVYFPDLANLRGQPIIGVETYDSTVLSYALSGNAVQARTDFAGVLVILYFDGGEFITIPLKTLLRLDGTNYNIFGDIPGLAGQNIIWPKSYLLFTNSTTITNTAGKSFVFGISYNRVK